KRIPRSEMRTLFTAEMSELRDDLIAIAEHVNTAISKASDALLTADLALAQEVIAADAQLDDVGASVAGGCVMLHPQHQRVGKDLRTNRASLRNSATLERMGGLARRIAEAARPAHPRCAVRAGIREAVARISAAAWRGRSEARH